MTDLAGRVPPGAALDPQGLDDLARNVRFLAIEVQALRAAIRSHRDARGDDRCWMDDEELYRVLPEGYTPPPRDTAVELENCRRFIASRQNPATVYVSPERELEALRAALDAQPSFPVYRCEERQCRYVFLDKRCCTRPKDHDGDHEHAPAALDAQPPQAPQQKATQSGGFNCSTCGHQHAGFKLGYICVGCPCERRGIGFVAEGRRAQDQP